MSKPKRRRMSSSDEDEVSSDGKEDNAEPDLQGSFLDVSCNEMTLSPPSDVVSPESSPVRKQNNRDDSLNPTYVNKENTPLDTSQVSVNDCSFDEDNGDNSYLAAKLNITELVDNTSFNASQQEDLTRHQLDLSEISALAAGSLCTDSFEDGMEVSTNKLSQKQDSQGFLIPNLIGSESEAESDNETEDSLSVGTMDSDGDGDRDMPTDASSNSDSDVTLSDEEIDMHSMEPPIYDEADITVYESMTALLAYIIRHEISGKEIVDLLNLVNLHCRKEGNKMHTTLYFFKKYFSILDVPVRYHYFCASCFEKLFDKNAVCPNSEQHPDLSERNVFVELPLIPQLKAYYSKEEFMSNFVHCEKRTKVNLSNVADIYDGRLYLELVEKGFFSESNSLNFSLMWNTDGIPVFHSNNKSLWPIFVNVLELAPHLRFKQENTLIAGLWFGKKPHVNLLLSPLLPTFQEIGKGFLVKPFGYDKEVKVQGVVLASTCDLPAKIMMLGMSSFSGSFGCQVCKIPGESVVISKNKKKKNNENKEEAGKKTYVWVYKYTKNQDLRTHKETVQFSREAQLLMEKSDDPKTNVFGVKYPSATFKIMYDAIRGFSIDDLHTLYLGVTKTLMKLWFDSKNSSECFSIRKYLPLVDKRLKGIKLPNFFERGVVCIEDDLSNWKGKDYLTWLHYLSVPILEGILADKYLQHHVDLVSCLQLLQSDSIPRNDLIACDKTLNNYVKNFEVLYGSRHMAMVVHSLLHLVFVVTNLGPLKYLSCFPCEGLNGEMLKMIHGTMHIETQLASSAYLLQKLPKRLGSLKPDSDVKNYCEKMLQPSTRLKILEKITDSTFSIGTYRAISNNEVTAALSKIVEIDVQSKLKSFLRLKIGKKLFLSREYKRTTRNNSYTCSFYDNGSLKYGAINEFVKLCTDVSPSFFAIIEMANVTQYIVGTKQVRHIMHYSLSGEVVAVPISKLKDMMVFLDVLDSGTYVCEPLDHSLKS